MESSRKILSPGEGDALLGEDQDLRGSLPSLPEVADLPPANDDRLSTVTPQELRAFLCRADVQRRIRDVVRARLGKDAPKQLAEDIAQDANVTMLSARALPRSMATADGWVSALARRAVVRHFRRGSSEAKWLDPEGDVDALPADGGEIPRDGWLISAWLAEAVQQNARDEETLELLVYQARTGKKYHEVAADHAITSQALKSRVHEFKKKYEPRWRRRQAMYVLIVLLGAALVAIAAALVWILVRPAPADIRPDPSPALPSATMVHPPQTPPEIAKALRDAAEKSCAERLWGTCTDELDDAKKLDPAGDGEERVQRLRGMIREGTRLQQEEKGGGKRP